MRRYCGSAPAIVIVVAVLLALVSPTAQAADPVRIGLSIAQTGALAANGKSALLAIELWKESVNAKGGLLGRTVDLVVYDDQSNPDVVPDLYKKLIEVDDVDLLVSGYGTNMIAAALPIAKAHGRVLLSLFGLAVNRDTHYPRYFTMTPTGPDPVRSVSRGFFELAAAMEPRPKTLAIVAADDETLRGAIAGVRLNARAAGVKTVYDRFYPLGTEDFAAVLRAAGAASPDLVYVASFTHDTSEIVRAAAASRFTARLFGGGMVGLQTTAIKTALGPLLNGIVNYDFWLPAPTLEFPGVLAMLRLYQSRAPSDGVDPLGYYLAPWAYAGMQVLAQAVEGTGSLDQGKLAEYLHATEFRTVMGDIRFDADGELSEARTIMVQYQRVGSRELREFRDGRNPIVVWPPKYRDGELLTPYEGGK